MSDLILYFGCFGKKKKKKYWVLFDSKFQVFFVPPKILVDKCGLASLDIGVGDCSFIGFILAKIELGRWHIVKKLKLLGD